MSWDMHMQVWLVAKGNLTQVITWIWIDEVNKMDPNIQMQIKLTVYLNFTAYLDLAQVTTCCWMVSSTRWILIYTCKSDSLSTDNLAQIITWHWMTPCCCSTPHRPRITTEHPIALTEVLPRILHSHHREAVVGVPIPHLHPKDALAIIKTPLWPTKEVSFWHFLHHGMGNTANHPSLISVNIAQQKLEACKHFP